MNLVELLLGIGVAALAAPFVGVGVTTGYVFLIKQWRAAQLDLKTDHVSKAVCSQQQAEMASLEHRKDKAKKMAEVITSEAQLAITQAHVEAALSSGDINTARKELVRALPQNLAHDGGQKKITPLTAEQITAWAATQQQATNQAYMNLIRSGAERREDERTIVVAGEVLPPTRVNSQPSANKE